MTNQAPVLLCAWHALVVLLRACRTRPVSAIAGMVERLAKAVLPSCASHMVLLGPGHCMHDPLAILTTATAHVDT